MIRLLRYLPIVLSIIGVIRKSRRGSAQQPKNTGRKR